MKRSDIGTACLLIAFGAGTAWQAKILSIGVPRAPGPGFFPFCLGILLIGVGGIIFAQGLKKKTEGRDTGQSKWRAYMALAAVFIYCFLMEPLGYLLSTFCLMYFLLAMMIRKKWWFGPLVACLFSLASYVLFGIWLQILLPKGIFGF